jgi:hypothetical protein
LKIYQEVLFQWWLYMQLKMCEPRITRAPKGKIQEKFTLPPLKSIPDTLYWFIKVCYFCIDLATSGQLTLLTIVVLNLGLGSIWFCLTARSQFWICSMSTNKPYRSDLVTLVFANSIIRVLLFFQLFVAGRLSLVWSY